MKKLFLLLLLPVILAGCVRAVDQEVEEQAKTTVNSPLLVSKSFQDIGTIAMDQGEVLVNFTIRNIGKDPVVIKSMQTSCMCTSAKLEIDGYESREAGMNPPGRVYIVLESEKDAVVEAIFDPNFHGPNDIGLKRRSIYLETNSSVNSKIKLDFQVNVVKTSDELPEKEIFDFQEKSFDFGVLKQSEGVVKHDFTFTYNGEEDVEILGIPTSCGCTSAKIDKEKLSKGDKGVITVSFDPNLHQEPEGRFFKTVSIVTDPAVVDIDDLKIWAEIDLDLGPQAYKLKGDHDEIEDEHEEPEYHSITPAVFEDMLQNKDFVLLDVHIPEQDHIADTDLFIPYNNIKANLSKLPQNKDDKIVVYCRSGSMSRAAAYTLLEMGYTNVYDLVGGKNAYDKL